MRRFRAFGYDFGAPASDAYEPPFTFNGTLHSVTFDVTGELITDDEAEIARMMAQQ
jgi:arylsulfatase